jgi:predicted O-linked N-acetylglucosamine transferase (SPINDLY family)
MQCASAIEAQNAELTELVRTGDLDGALTLATQLTELHPSHGLAWKVLGTVLWTRDRREEAITALAAAAARLPDDAEAHANLGMALAAMQRLELAESSLRTALALNPDGVGRVMELQLAGECGLAERLYGGILEKDPMHAAANQLLGTLKLQLGKPREGLRHFLVALNAQPANADYWLGYLEALRRGGGVGDAKLALAAARRRGVASEAMDWFERRLAADLGESAPASVATGADPRQRARERELEALLARRRFPEALRLAERLTGAFPDSGTAWKVFGELSWERERTVDAARAMQKGVQLLPDSAEALTNFGSALSAMQRFEEAEICLRQAILLDPTYLAAYYRLATHCDQHARVAEAEALLRKALAMRSAVLTRDDAMAHSDLIFLLSHQARLDAAGLLAEHRHFRSCVEAPLVAEWPSHANPRHPERRLRVGFVSGDLRDHPVAMFLEPILEQLTTMPGYELYGYSASTIDDAVTVRLRDHFDRWRSVGDLLDHELAAKIRADRIDILIDLSGHTAANRLVAFAHKPAPIQVSWLGYPASTGLEAMDYYLADAHWLPPGEYDGLFTEKLVYLPDRWTYAPRDPGPDIEPLPALAAGHFTFASFHQVRKLNVETIDAWAQLLLAVPDARLLIAGIHRDAQQQGLSEQFERAGIPTSRLSFYRQSDFSTYLALHHRVDLCLDTLPYCGGTTTMHAAWMGVPTLTIAGATAPGRAGAGIAASLGLECFVAKNCAEFVAKGLFWSSHCAELARVRRELRGRVRNSRGGDPGLIAAHLDGAMRHMWQRWCANLVPESFHSCGPDKAAGRSNNPGLYPRLA